MAVVLALALTTGACRRQLPSGAGSHLRIGLGANPATLDPHAATGTPEEMVVSNVFAGLFEYDPVTAAPVPELAASWEMTSDAMTYTFTLRSAKWSNGDPLTAHDFVYSWRRALDPNTASELASLLYPILNAREFNRGTAGPDDIGVQALDDLTLEVRMQRPTAYFLSLVTHWVYRPVHPATIETWGADWARPEHMVVSGPFRLAEWRPGDKLVLRKNQEYWDASSVGLEQVTFYLAENTTALLNLYEVGDLDTIMSGLLPIQQVPRLRRRPDYAGGPFLSLYHYLVNVSRPPLDRKDVRRALNLALDRQQICDRLLQGGQRPAGRLVPGDFGGRYPGPVGFNRDPVQAQRLLRQSGYPDGEGLTLTLTFSSLDIHRRIAEAIQAQWRTVFPGIQVELRNLEWQVFQDARRQRDFDIALRHWTADYNDPYTFLELMRSDYSGNTSGWANTEYDRRLDRANTTPDPAERYRRLAEAETLVVEESPFIPVYEGSTFFLITSSVHGWTTNILDKHPLKFVSISH